MHTRALGKSGFEVGEVGLGCWQLGGDWGELDEKTAFRILESAHLNGIDFFDTADVYGGGRSERLIGDFIRGQGIKPTIATKHGRMGLYPDKYSRAALRDGVEASCERLRVDRLDLVQLHCVPTAVLRQGEIFGWLDDLVAEGTARAWGASVESVEQGLLCLEQPGCRSLQVIFNIFRQKPAFSLLPAAAERGVGIIVRLPLASGLLAGKFRAEARFAASDHRNYNRDGQAFNVGETFAGLRFATGVKFADQLKAMVPEGWTMAEWSLRWILDHPEVSVIIPGASSPSQIPTNAAASERPPLNRGIHSELREFYDQHVAREIRGPY
jgi:aryl-alcohol dehydrogenase-like predicted oxidoreductase